NLANFNGSTALIFAVTFNRVDMISLLLNNGADVNLKDDRGNTAISHAQMQKNAVVVDLLNRLT
ncbi:MAG: ankyrin repeat domain-containing protein, partial [Bacteroidetes bacterium]|nr:ankyrin repeat domain-containing protein [Bacteroidota bacterium]